MIVSENEVYQIVKKSCVSEKIYEDWADDIGKAIAFLQKNNIDGCEEFKNLICATVSKNYITIFSIICYRVKFIIIYGPYFYCSVN